MTTKSNNENFYEIWNLFEKEVIKKFGKNTKNEPNFSEFAKFNQKQDTENLDENDYKKVYNKLLNRYKGINKNIKRHPDTITQMENYYKILKNDYFIQELLDDETPEHWFD